LPSAPDRTIVCYVTDGQAFPAADRERLLLERIRTALTAGAHWVQIREKDLSARRLLALVRESVRIGRAISPAARILVNDRLDVALAAGAAGVHLGGESVPREASIQWCRAGNASAGFLVGISCHSVDEAKTAESAGTDYVFFGPIFDTPSKRIFGPPQGSARLAAVCRSVSVPVIAIGGINESNVADCIGAGAKGVAAIRLFQDARDSATATNFISAVHGRFNSPSARTT